MSTRTIIEVNHDHLRDLERPEIIAQLVRLLSSGTASPDERYPLPTQAIRILAQRHHSDALSIAVGYTIRHEE